jgi:hypothetical protein
MTVGILGLAQGFVGLAVNFLPAEPNVILARSLFVGAGVCVVVAVLLLVRPQKTEEPTATATQSGSRNVQIQGQTVNFQGTISTGEEEVQTARLSDGRTLVGVTPEYLTELFDEHTSIQAEKLIEAFIGKWMRLSGPVGNVSAIGEDAVSVSLKSETFEHPVVFLRFYGKCTIENQLRVLKKGDEITVIGQIREVTSMWIELENCELEKP